MTPNFYFTSALPRPIPVVVGLVVALLVPGPLGIAHAQQSAPDESGVAATWRTTTPDAACPVRAWIRRVVRAMEAEPWLALEEGAHAAEGAEAQPATRALRIEREDPYAAEGTPEDVMGPGAPLPSPLALSSLVPDDPYGFVSGPSAAMRAPAAPPSPTPRGAADIVHHDPYF